MDRSELLAKLTELESAVDGLRRDMEPACREFLDATKRFVETSVGQRVEEAVLARPEALKTLSPAAIRDLKAETKRLAERAPELVETHLNKNGYWAHRRQVLDDSAVMLNLLTNPYERHGDRPPELLNRAIGDVLGVVSGLLARYGFPAGRPRAETAPEWTAEMNAAMDRYATLFARLKRLNSELLPLRRRLDDQDARRRWDEA
ncbi:MAG: hypothetical protein HY359_05430 [Candidatus Rokubacteria bacterium]|nr:hypothetical protein [Candidatus Rokubacteria bacterium]